MRQYTLYCEIILMVLHSFFNDDRYVPLGILMSRLYKQYVLLRCDQVCFGGATILKNNKPKSLITQ